MKLYHVGLRSCIAVVLSLTFFSSPDIGRAAGDDIVHVSPNGYDSSQCGGEANPCRTIQHGVERAADGDTVRVAAGRYTFSEDRCGRRTVVCITGKEIAIRGGFAPGDWSTVDPGRYQTIIDGEHQYRGVLVRGTVADPANPSVGLTMSGFVIQNGLARGASSGPDDQITGPGGGMFVDFGHADLSDLVFRNNRAQGGHTSGTNGGSGSGGGLAMKGSGVAWRPARLRNIRFENNIARGGDGRIRGGFAIGGGLYTFRSHVRAEDLHVVGNQAIAGTGRGSGFYGFFADAQGGGAAFQLGSNVTIQGLYVAENMARGGAAPGGDAGGAFGGALFAEVATVSVEDATLDGNLAHGGDGDNSGSPRNGAGIAEGGGIKTSDSDVILDRISISNNRAVGGAGSTYRGPAGGGGGSFKDYQGDQLVTITNAVISANGVEAGTGKVSSGGGGGGLWFQGIEAELNHVTVVDNRLGVDESFQGQSVLLITANGIPARVDLENSIVAGHSNTQNTPAIYVKSGNSLSMQHLLFSGNSTSDYGGPGSITGQSTIRSVPEIGFLSSSADDHRFRIGWSSPAVDEGAPSDVDYDRADTPRDTAPDIGAYEAAPFHAEAVPVEDGAVRVSWIHTADINAYRLTVSCPAGADAPLEIGCNRPRLLEAGKEDVQHIHLSGLTNHVKYPMAVEALDDHQSVLNDTTITIVPTDIFLYLPLMQAH